MQPLKIVRPSGSTRGFTTQDPERQGVLVANLHQPDRDAYRGPRALSLVRERIRTQEPGKDKPPR